MPVHRRLVLACVALVCLFTAALPGQTIISFNQTGAGPHVWTTGTNWNTGSAPNAAGAWVNIVSDITANATINLPSNQTVGQLFLGDYSNGNTFTIGSTGGALVFDNGTNRALLSKVLASSQVDRITANVSMTNGLIVNVNPGGATAELDMAGVLSGTGPLIVTGSGRLRMSGSASNTYTGVTYIENRGFGDAGNPTFVLAKTGGATAITGDIRLGNVSKGGGGSAVLAYSANAGVTSEQIADGAVIYFDASSSNNSFFKLMGYEETIRGVVDYTREGVIEVTQDEATPTGVAGGLGVQADSTLTLQTQAGDDFYYNSYFRNRSGGSSTAVLHLRVLGAGSQTLAGDRVNYTGQTQIGAGATLVLENTTNFNSASVANDGTLVFNYSSTSTFSKNITGTGRIVRTGGAGTMTFTGSIAAGAGIEIRDGGLNTATSAAIFDGAVNVSAGGFSIIGKANTNTVTWNGVVTVGAGGLSLDGQFASLVVTSASQVNGAVNIQQGDVRLTGGNGSLGAGVTGITLRGLLSSLVMENTAAANNADRVAGVPISMEGGTISFTNGANSGAFSEDLGALTLLGGANTINAQQASGGTSFLRFASLSRDVALAASATVNFTGTGLGDNTLNQIIFTSSPTLTDSLIGGWAYVNGTEFATYASGSVKALATTGSAETTWTGAGTVNAKITGAQTLTAARHVNSLNMQSGTAFNLSLGASGAFHLTIDSGGLISSGNNHQIIRSGTSSGTLRVGDGGAGDDVLFANVASNQLTIAVPIVNNGGATSLVKTGNGILVLNATNTYTGKTTVTQGTLTINGDDRLGAAPGAFTADQLKLDGGMLRINGNTTFNANRGITLGYGGGNLQVADSVVLTLGATNAIAGANGRLTLVTASGNTGIINSAANNNLSGGLFTTGGVLDTQLNFTGNNTVGQIDMVGGTVSFATGTNVFNGSIFIGNDSMLVLGGSNTINVTVAMNAGTLRLNSATAAQASGFTLNMTGGAFDLNGFNTRINNLTGNEASNILIGSAAGVGATSTLTLHNTKNTTFAGTISNGGLGQKVSVVKTGDGVLTLGVESTYTGTTRLEGGVVNVVDLDYNGFGSSFGAGGSTPSAADLVINGATLRYIGNVTVADHWGQTDRSFTLGLGTVAGGIEAGTISADGVGIGSELWFGQNSLGTAGAVAFEGAGARTLTLSGTNRSFNYFDLVLGDQNVTTGKTSLRKHGIGTWILTNANTYSGGTTILQGMLGGTTDGAFGTGNIAIVGGSGGSSTPGGNNATMEFRGMDNTNTSQNIIMEGGMLYGSINPETADASSSWAGGVIVAASSNISVDPGARLALNGQISGVGALVKYGDGTLVFGGSVGADRNAATSATVNVLVGTLVLDYASNIAEKLSNSSSLILGGSRLGGEVQLKRHATTTVIEDTSNLTSGAVGVVLNSGANRITVDNNGGLNTGRVVLRMNTISRATGATLNIQMDDIASTDTNNTNGILGGWATVGLADWAFKSDVDDVTLGAVVGGQNGLIRRYTGYTNSSAFDDWVTGAGGNMTVTGDNTQDGETANSLRFHAPDGTGDKVHTVTLTGTNVIASGGILVTPNMGDTTALINGSGTLATGLGASQDLLIIQNNTASPFEIAAVIANGSGGSNGIDKTGEGKLILSGLNTYTGVTTLNNGTTVVKTLANGGIASSIGSAANSVLNLVFNGGTLQYSGAGNTSSNRQFIINTEATWDIGNENSVLTWTGQYATAGADGDYIIRKAGDGTFVMTNTRVSGFGITEWVAEDGTVRLVASSDHQFARSDLGKLTMAGGTFELQGSGTGTRNHTMPGVFTVQEGASTIRVRSAAGLTTNLTLQNTLDPAVLTFNKGSTLLVSIDPNGGQAQLIIAANFSNLNRILSRVVYQNSTDIPNPGVNYFAVIDSNGERVIASDNPAIGGATAHTTIGDVATLAGNAAGAVHATDGSLASDGFTGSTVANAFAKTLRFFNNQSPSTITISNKLTLTEGAILLATHSGNAAKSITGGQLTSGLFNSDGSVDLILHNWNPLRAFSISSAIVNNGSSALNLIQSGDGVTSLSGTNTYTGTTYLFGGVLRLDSAGALPTNSHVRFDGGVLGLASGDFTRSLGTGAAEVDWTGAGGFAAYGSNRTVNIGGAGATLTWGLGGFVRDNTALIFGAYDATHRITFANGINLGGQERMVKVEDGQADEDARITGVITGTGSLVKSGHGGLTLSTANTYTGGTYVAQGYLSGTSLNSYGTGGIFIGATGDSRTVDIAEFRHGAGNITNAITVGNATAGVGNSEGVSLIRNQTTLTFGGAMTLNRDVFLAAANTLGTANTATYSGQVTGAGRIRVIQGGTVSLTGSNSYGTSGGASGSSVNGGTVIRSGTITVSNSLSLGGTTVELGDVTTAKASVKFATAGRSLLGVERTIPDNADPAPTTSTGGPGVWGGSFIAGGNGLREANGVASAGNGAFYSVAATIDGGTMVLGDRILVKDEDLFPERNGIYQVVQVNPDGTVNLARVADFDQSGEMTYGSQVLVTNGTANAGKAFFMASPDITTPNGADDPGHWLQDNVDANASLLAAVNGITVANAIDVNPNGAGTSTLGANNSVTTGATFSGAITLQSLLAGAEAKTLTLFAQNAAATVTFGGVISEASGSDTLALSKTGAGTVRLDNNNTYRGTTVISSGVLEITKNNALGDTVAGTQVLSGAALELIGPVAVGAEALTLSGSGLSDTGALRNVSGTNSWAGTVTLQDDSRINADAGSTLTLSNANAVSTQDKVLTVGGEGSVNIDGIIAQGVALSGALLKDGVGALTLRGANTYAGGTTVNAGALYVSNSTGSGTGSGSIAVNNVGSRFGGTGHAILGANKTFTLATGTIMSVGDVTSVGPQILRVTTSGVSGVVTIQGELQFDLFSAGNDRIVLQSDANAVWTTDWKLTVTNQDIVVNDTNFFIGRTWDLLDWSAAMGNIDVMPTGGNLVLPSLVGTTQGQIWDTSQFHINGTISIVPEPGRAVLLLLGAGLMVVRRRRRK